MSVDYEAISAVMMEITPRVKLMQIEVPEEHSELLKHLAAAMIHLTFFMKDILDHKENKNTTIPGEEEFVQKCGCDYFKQEKQNEV